MLPIEISVADIAGFHHAGVQHRYDDVLLGGGIDILLEGRGGTRARGRQLGGEGQRNSRNWGRAHAICWPRSRHLSAGFLYRRGPSVVVW